MPSSMVKKRWKTVFHHSTRIDYKESIQRWKQHIQSQNIRVQTVNFLNKMNSFTAVSGVSTKNISIYFPDIEFIFEFYFVCFFNHGANYVIFVWILNSKWKTEENKKKNIEKETNTIKMNLKEIKSEFWMCFLVPKVKSKSFSVVGHHHKMLCVAEINVIGHFIFSSTFASSSNVFFIGFYFIILFFFLNGTSTDHVDTRKRFFLLQLMCIVYSFEWQRLFFFFLVFNLCEHSDHSIKIGSALMFKFHLWALC